MPDDSVTSEVKAAVKKWGAGRNLNAFSGDTAYDWQSVAVLTRKGCSASDIVNVLELLWHYCQGKRFDKIKSRRESWLRRGKSLVRNLRKSADEAEDFLQFIATRPPLTSSSPPSSPALESGERASLSDENDSDDDSTSKLPSPASELKDEDDSDLPVPFAADISQAELWDVMRSYADDLDARIRMEEDNRLPFAQPFTREMGGTLPFLVIAVALVKEATGQNHYSEISNLLQAICPQKALDEDAMGKKVNRFRRRPRNEEFVEEFIENDSEEERIEVREIVKTLLRNLQ